MFPLGLEEALLERPFGDGRRRLGQTFWGRKRATASGGHQVQQATPRLVPFGASDAGTCSRLFGTNGKQPSGPVTGYFVALKLGFLFERPWSERFFRHGAAHGATAHRPTTTLSGVVEAESCGSFRGGSGRITSQTAPSGPRALWPKRGPFLGNVSGSGSHRRFSRFRCGWCWDLRQPSGGRVAAASVAAGPGTTQVVATDRIGILGFGQLAGFLRETRQPFGPIGCRPLGGS